MLPNLIVIGAGRCGTTSLHRYLDLHPDIAMSDEKELSFFSYADRWELGAAWYERQFRPGTLVRGESSPSYTAYPVFPDVPARMASLVPGARLIYLVREPIARLLSSYRFARYVLGREERGLTEAVRDFETSRYVIGSSYGLQLERFLAHYPASQILVIDHADLLNRRAETMRVVFAHAGVDDSFTTAEFAREHNPTDGLRANRAGWAAIGVMDRTLGPSRSAALRARVPLSLVRPLLRQSGGQEVELDPSLRAELEDHFGHDVSRLRNLTGRQFEAWNV